MRLLQVQVQEDKGMRGQGDERDGNDRMKRVKGQGDEWDERKKEMRKKER